jgi:hypothetical protein
VTAHQMNQMPRDDMQSVLREVFTRILSRNLRAGGRRDYFLIDVTDVSPNDREFEIRITYRAGELYCCAESMCHFGCWRPSDWGRIRSVLTELGVRDLGPLTVTAIRTTVEAGARFGSENRDDESPVWVSPAHHWVEGPFSEAEALLEIEPESEEDT